jgi:tRNA pseudouridine 55 synthase
MAEEFFTVDKRAIELLSGNIDDYPNGIVIPIDKPYKWTSADVVRKIKFIAQRHFKKKNIKVGHAGTLDPLATGVLLVCIGKATKMAETLQSEAKEYLAQIELGATTPCFDMEKEIDATYPYEHITKEMVNNILPTFIGEQDQVPPIFSAKLIDGKRAYEIARAGEDVVMKPSVINIYDLEIVEFNLPRVVIRVKCSKGTYIRSFARDFGVALQSGGYLSGLVRLSSGKFTVSNSLKMEDIEKILQK